MRRQRGFILMYGLAVLAVVLGAVMLLARAAGSRTDSLREDAAREKALRGAESALEQARIALYSGRLKAGQSLAIDGYTVSCVPNGNDVKLETLALCAPAPAKPGAPPRRGVRVSWELHAAGSEWKITGWRSINETVAQ